MQPVNANNVHRKRVFWNHVIEIPANEPHEAHGVESGAVLSTC